MKHIVAVVFALSVFWQGGFSDMAWLVFGAIAAILLIVKIRVFPPVTVNLLFAGLILAYAAATVLHGSHMEGWVGTAKITAAYLWVVLFHNIEIDIDDTVFVSGLVAATSGILAYCGLLPVMGMVSAGRLQGPFQYANAFALLLGVCALLARLSKKAKKRSHFAGLMEIALFLTQSVGGIAVFIGGFVLLYSSNKENRKILDSQMPCMIFSLVCAGTMFVFANYLPVYAAIFPAASIFLLQQPFEYFSKYSGLKWIMAGILVVFGAIVFYRTGMRPFGTYIERLIQISDGVRTIVENPLGIGPGAWQFEVYARQSAFYDAVFLHGGYISIGVDAGISAIAFCLALIFCKIRRNLVSKYNIAMYMILFHALFDFSLSFFAVIFLLCGLGAPQPNKKETSLRRINVYKILFVPCLMIFAILIIPKAAINNAKWAAISGDYSGASDILNTPFLDRDTEAKLLKLYYTAKMEHFERFDEVFVSLDNPNSEAYYHMTHTLLERGIISEATDMAELCAKNAPYHLSGYELMEEVGKQIVDPEIRENHAAKILGLKKTALEHIHPLAKYIPDDRGIH